MGNWKIGFPEGLDSVTDYEDGKLLYDSYGVEPINLDSKMMCRAVGKVSSVVGSTLTLESINNYPNSSDTPFTPTNSSLEDDEYNNGFIRFLSGNCQNEVYKVSDTVSPDTLVSSDTFCSSGVTVGDYLEVVTGSCTFEFKLPRNPIRRDFKRQISISAVRFPYYSGGLVIPIGFQPDDYVFSVNMTEERDIDRLELFLNHHLDFKGFDGLYSTGYKFNNDDGLAPVVLETGTHDIKNQFLGTIEDYKIIKDAQRGDSFWEVLIHMKNYSRILYRGI